MSAVEPTGSAGGVGQVIALRQQIIDRSASLQSLRQSGGTGGTDGIGVPNSPTTGPASQPTFQPGGGFADTLKSAVDNVNSTQVRASEMTAAYERGEVTDIAKVMLARQESGLAFEATLQVRNKLLSAYQDIMRMGV